MQYLIKRLSLLLFLFSLTSSAFAVEIEKGIYDRDKISRPGIRIYLDVETDEVKDAFEDFLKKNYGFRLKGNGLFANKDELYAEKVEVEEIIDKQINWYTQIIPAPRNEHKTQMTIFVSLGYDIYLNEDEYPKAYQKVYDLSVDFLEQFIPEYHEERIEEMADTVEDLEDDTSDLEKDISRNNKEIEKLKEEIREMEAEREEKLAELNRKRETLQAQKDAFRNAKRDLRRIN